MARRRVGLKGRRLPLARVGHRGGCSAWDTAGATDWVYVTSGKWQAWLYAAGHSSDGALYECEPMGRIVPIGEVFPENVDPFIMRCERARIRSVYELPGDMKIAFRDAVAKNRRG